ncbi:MAG TPA: hypothetical protein ENK07_09595 [Bacteroidetes bacterium]|nr:hypothetical protein [Bacteroidota bacterium]
MADEKRLQRVTVSPPETVAELQEMYAKVSDDPKSVAALFFMAMLQFTRDARLGQDLVTFLMTREHAVTVRGGEKAPCRSVMYHLGRLEDHPHIARSYLEGATPANGYDPGAPPHAIVIERVHEINPDRVRLYVTCSGAESARPLVLQREDGGWKVREESSLYSGTMAPASP